MVREQFVVKVTGCVDERRDVCTDLVDRLKHGINCCRACPPDRQVAPDSDSLNAVSGSELLTGRSGLGIIMAVCYHHVPTASSQTMADCKSYASRATSDDSSVSLLRGQRIRQEAKRRG